MDSISIYGPIRASRVSSLESLRPNESPREQEDKEQGTWQGKRKDTFPASGGARRRRGRGRPPGMVAGGEQEKEAFESRLLPATAPLLLAPRCRLPFVIAIALPLTS